MTGLQWLSSELTALDTGILLSMNSLSHSAQEDLDECEPPQTSLQDLLKDLDHVFTESDTEVCPSNVSTVIQGALYNQGALHDVTKNRHT